MTGKNDLTTADLHIILNSPSIVSAIFKRKRALGISQIRFLAVKLNIPAPILIKKYTLLL